MPSIITRGAMSARGFGFGYKASGGLKVQDVFAVNTWTGSGTPFSVTNGINLSANGGLVWVKKRSAIQDHVLADTARGATSELNTNATAAAQVAGSGYDIGSFNSNGYSIGGFWNYNLNSSGDNYVGWSFRKATKFFDVVTGTTDSSGNITINHGLGVTPGMVFVKAVNLTQDWFVYHASVGNNAYLRLNATSAQASFSGAFSATSTTFTANGNSTNSLYVYYLFAHDPDTTNGIIQCGSMAAGTTSVTLGWQPQYILFKASGSPGGSWWIVDTTRGWDAANDITLLANSAIAEPGYSNSYNFQPTSTGFTFNLDSWDGAKDYIYMCIRKGPM